MEDIVLIKLYRNGFQDDDYHDWMVDRYPIILKELEQYFSKLSKSLYFVAFAIDPLHEVPIDGKPFAEVEYTGVLTQEEKEECLTVLKKLSSDVEWIETKKGRKKEYEYKEFSTLTLVKFRKIDKDEEIVNLDQCDVQCVDESFFEEE